MRVVYHMYSIFDEISVKKCKLFGVFSTNVWLCK